MLKNNLIIYWLRRDLRLHDNKALLEATKEAAKEGNFLLPIFVIEDYMKDGKNASDFSYLQKYFLSKALISIYEYLPNLNIIFDKGAKAILDIYNKYKSEYKNIIVYVNDDYHFDFYKQINKLKNHGICIEIFEDIFSSNKNILTGNSNTYSIFTPYKKAIWTEFVNKGFSKTPDIKNANLFNNKYIKYTQKELWENFDKKRNLYIYINDKKYFLDLDKITISPDLDFIDKFWYFDEKSAITRFEIYMKNSLSLYDTNRDSLEKDNTSHMGLALTFGLVSSRMLIIKLKKYFNDNFDNPFSQKNTGVLTYINELIWREFYHYNMYHRSYLINTEFQEKYRNNILWQDKDKTLEFLKLWIQGKTGYDIVDAAMMQIQKTGYMHNRARMIVASILSKNLGIDWRHGQAYFQSILMDLDDASNNGGWQWGASVGIDPKPIRIFNPELQAENYDKSEEYRKKYLGNDFKNRNINTIIPHKIARDEALKRYGLNKKSPFRDF